MRRFRQDDAGATVIEYSLAVALVLVVSLGGIEALNDRGSDRLAASGDRAGQALDGAYYPGVVTTTTAAGATTTTVASTPGAQPSAVTASPAASNSGSKWIANATIKVTTTASPFGPVAGMVVSGVWSFPTGPTDSASCTTTAAGTCTVQETDIQDNRETATFTITSITGPNFTWTPGAGDVVSVAVACPGSPTTCD